MKIIQMKYYIEEMQEQHKVPDDWELVFVDSRKHPCEYVVDHENQRVFVPARAIPEDHELMPDEVSKWWFPEN